MHRRYWGVHFGWRRKKYQKFAKQSRVRDERNVGKKIIFSASISFSRYLFAYCVFLPLWFRLKRTFVHIFRQYRLKRWCFAILNELFWFWGVDRNYKEWLVKRISWRTYMKRVNGITIFNLVSVPRKRQLHGNVHSMKRRCSNIPNIPTR